MSSVAFFQTGNVPLFISVEHSFPDIPQQKMKAAYFHPQISENEVSENGRLLRKN